VSEREKNLDIPRWRFVTKDTFENTHSLACWSPNDPTGPHVLLNGEAGMFEDVIQYHQQRYPEIYADDVAMQVRRAFGYTAASKVAHIHKVMKRALSRQEIASRHLSEDALTVALCGLLAEDALIERFLRDKLGRAPAAPKVVPLPSVLSEKAA
jgi:hypothetical protein